MLGGTVKPGRRFAVAQRVLRNVGEAVHELYLEESITFSQSGEKKVERVFWGSRVNKIIEGSVKGAFLVGRD